MYIEAVLVPQVFCTAHCVFLMETKIHSPNPPSLLHHSSFVGVCKQMTSRSDSVITVPVAAAHHVPLLTSWQ